MPHLIAMVNAHAGASDAAAQGYFWLSVLVTLGGAFCVLVSRSIARMISGMCLCFCGVAALLACLGQPALALAELLVSANGMVVLLLAAVAAMGQRQGRIARIPRGQMLWALVLSAGIGALLVAVLLHVPAPAQSPAYASAAGGALPPGGAGAMATLGRALLGPHRYLAATECCGFLFFIACLGGSFLVHRRQQPAGHGDSP
jgi:NADH:ubiquinone oxidoreductase subunit 6 (subunit J)